jgi:hypothetical protein
MSNLQHRATLYQAVEAARSGDRPKAREMVESVLQEDEENAQAWLLLARLAHNDDEARMALTTVLQLDPDNKKAADMLQKLEASPEAAPDEEIMPGVPRRLFIRVAAGVAGLTIVLVIIALAVSISSSQRAAQAARTATAVVLAPTHILETSTAIASETAGVEMILQETQFAITSPTPTATPTHSGPTLPPTATATEPPTATPTLEPLTHIPGRIIGWRGRDLRGLGFLPLVVYSLPEGGQPVQIGPQEARRPTISPDGQRIVYTAWHQTTERHHLEMVNMDGEEILPPFILEALRFEAFEDSQMPSFSFDGSQLVFVAFAPDSRTTEVFLYIFDVPEGTPPIIRLTNDSANYTFPALSPDGNRVVVVRDDPASENPGPDLVLIDVNTRAPSSLTTDRFALRETNPRWSPDGTLIVYAAAPEGDASNHDLYIIAANNPGSGLKLVETTGNDIYPIFSPDQRYLAFASNQDGNYDIFIFDLQARELSRLTATREDDFPSDWVN